MAALGHASVTTSLDHYGHLFGDELDRLADGLDAAARAAGKDRLRTPATGKVVRMPSAAGQLCL